MDVKQRADKLAQLIEEKLGTRGHGLETKLKRAGRRLPGYLRRDLDYVVQAMHMEANPRLARQIDWTRIDRAFAAAEHHLGGIDPWERRRGFAISWLAGNAFNILLVVALAVAAMAWRGLV